MCVHFALQLERVYNMLNKLIFISLETLLPTTISNIQTLCYERSKSYVEAADNFQEISRYVAAPVTSHSHNCPSRSRRISDHPYPLQAGNSEM